MTDLRKLEARYQRAVRRAEELRLERLAAIHARVGEGRTHAEIAKEIGLTRGRIGQIAPPQKKKAPA